MHPSIITCEELRAGVDKSDLNELVSAVEGERLSTSGKRKVRHFFIGTILSIINPSFTVYRVTAYENFTY